MFQTRSEVTGLAEYQTLEDAYRATVFDTTIWKISFSMGSERVRLEKNQNEQFVLVMELVWSKANQEQADARFNRK